MAGPYRPETEPPLARYALRTSRVAYLPAVVGAALLLSGGWMVVRFSILGVNATELLVLAAGLALVVWGLFGTSELRIGGGRGELRIYRDRVEVPRAAGREPMVLLRDRFRVTVVQQIVRFMLFGIVPAGEMNRGFVMTLIFVGGTRRLSDRVFASRQLAERAADDLSRVSQGLDPHGPAGPKEAAPGPAPELDDLDARIDEELRNL